MSPEDTSHLPAETEPQDRHGSRPPRDLRSIVLANDVRGIAGEELDEDAARAFGAAFADSLDKKDLIVAHDMRSSSPQLAQAFAEGASRRGATVGLSGLSSTDQLYCASGLHWAAGAMITASHNPPAFNGIKLCLSGARPISRSTGLDDLRVRAEELLGAGEIPEIPGGRAQELDTLEDYVATVLRLAPVPGARRLRVVADAGNGMAGLTMPAVAERLDGVDVIPLHFELDGTFPHHPADPTDRSSLVELSQRVREEQADLGLAFDGDADRCVIVDESGAVVPPSAITALIAEQEIARARAEGKERPAVVANVVSSRHVGEAIEAAGGRRLRTPVGHSLIKAVMAQENAIFGGEHSAHYYFRDFFFADSGMIAALHVLAALSRHDGPMSALVAARDPYVGSGEINRRVADAEAARERVRAAFVGRPGVTDDHLDGLTLEHWPADGTDDPSRWWLSLRSSNTEQALRLNVEASREETMRAIRDEVLDLLEEPASAPEEPASALDPEAVARSAAEHTGTPADTREHTDMSTATMAEMPTWVREILRCPQCGATLTGDDGTLRCTQDAHTYRIESGIPQLVAGRD